MEFVVGAMALLAGWFVCWIQMSKSESRKLQSANRSVVYWCQMAAALEKETAQLKASVLGLMSEKAQVQEMQMAILTDLEKALERNSELRSQLASLLEMEIRMDSTPEPVMGLELGSGKWMAKPDQSAFLSGSALVDQELDLD